jgi:hypothetical protein
MRAPLKLSLRVEIFIIDSIRLFLRNLVNRLMIALLDLSSLSVTYTLVILLLILTMNVLTNCCILLIIIFWV